MNVIMICINIEAIIRLTLNVLILRWLSWQTIVLLEFIFQGTQHMYLLTLFDTSINNVVFVWMVNLIVPDKNVYELYKSGTAPILHN